MTVDDRTAAALERIATALERSATAQEQMALERNFPPTVVWGPTGIGTGMSDEPPLPTPPPDLVTHSVPAFESPNQSTVALPPVQPFQFTGPTASCPVHRVPWKTVPAGTSRKTGKPYGAFLVCSVQGCEERPRA